MANSSISQNLAANNAFVALDSGMNTMIAGTVTGTFVGTVTFQALYDSSEGWQPAICFTRAAATASNTLTAPGSRFINAQGALSIRALLSPYTSGLAEVTLSGSPASSAGGGAGGGGPVTATITPTFTGDGGNVLGAGVLARGSTARGTLDLRTAFGAYLFVKVGRGGTTAIAGGTLVGVKVQVRRVLNNDTAMPGGVHPAGSPALLSGTVAAAATTVAADSAAGQPNLNVALITGFASEDVICIQDAGGGVTRLEFHRVSKTATGILTLDRNLQFAHTAAQADTVRNQASVFSPIWLLGGSLWECIVDYGDATAGESITYQVLSQTYAAEGVA
jgi:hypothetical protein